METWLKFNERYSVSSKGEVRNDKTNRILKGDLNRKGYRRVIVSGKRYFIHRLVAIVYIPNPNNYPQVNHKDGNKLNNAVYNLEWCTNDYNNKHARANGLIINKTPPGEDHFRAKLKESEAVYIKYSLLPVTELSIRFNISKITIYKIRQGKMWKHI